MRPDARSVLPLAAIAALAAVEGLQGFGVSLFTPDLAATFRVSALSLLSARAAAMALGTAVPLLLPQMSVLHRQQVNTWVVRVGAMVCAVSLGLTGVVTSTAGLVAVLCLTAVASTPGQLQRRAVGAASDPATRLRALSVVQGALVGGQLVLAAAAAGGLVDSWQAALRVAGVAAAVVVVAALVQPALPGAAPAAPAPPAASAPRWPEVIRAWRTSSPAVIGLGCGLLGAATLTLPFEAVFAIFLHSRWQLGIRGTAVVFGIVSASSLGAILVARRRRPAHAWRLLAAGAAMSGIGVSLPSRAAMVVITSGGLALVSASVPLLASLGFEAVPAEQHEWISAASAAALSAGGLLGVVAATSFADRHGPRVALIAMAALGAIAALAARAVRDVAPAAVPRAAEAPHTRHGRVPLLDCRGLSFGYGPRHVLREVDFTVADGEVVALLGTNGAGKSTLLNVISGLALPQHGTVRLAGRDITYLAAEERVRTGVIQVPGGRAVFAPLTVVENLQAFGYSLGRDRRRIDAAIERCLDEFPQLRARRAMPAATLSGGEQQMLGLTKALLLRPRLLLVDELALGLAPGAIRPLLDMIRRINADGTSIVIVEQSVNIALSLVDHVYFMEKGTIRFDGPAQQLLDRHDLLRAVFLEGAAKAALG